MAQELWERLRATGLQDLAPELFDQGVRCVQDILPAAPALGVPSWKLEAIVRGRLETNVASPPGRADHPEAQVRNRASWPAALEAAQPQNRAAALCELKTAILAATTRPSVDSRLKTWTELSSAWELPPWPLTVTLVHSLGASFKRGRYHSSSLYFGAAIAHQLRTLGMPVGEEIRFAVDTVRAIKRGLGPTQLKDSFDFEALKSRGGASSV